MIEKLLFQSNEQLYQLKIQNLCLIEIIVQPNRIENLIMTKTQKIPQFFEDPRRKTKERQKEKAKAQMQKSLTKWVSC